LLACRRPREEGQKAVWAVHVLALASGADEAVEYETDRARFLGRGRTSARPVALGRGARLSGTAGAGLDPVFSLRHSLRRGPRSSASLAFVTAVAETRDEALLLADQYHDARAIPRTFELAWAESQIELQHLRISPASIQLFQRLSSAALFPDASWRATPDVQ